MRDPNGYTVGWICALEVEYVAAQEMLDNEHEEGPEYVSAGDTNDYTLGELGNHKIVIAALPVGEYGTSSASNVATNMRNSFPNVRIGLLVGVGGGAPRKGYDIRLGDVVVSEPGNGTGGVLQYDFGKTVQDQAFQRTRYLNQPPVALRTALTGIKARHARKGHQLDKIIETALGRNPLLLPGYQRPPPESDRLLKSDFVHRPGDCAESCASESSMLISRDPRTPTGSDPMVHYGIIASADQVMKDAMIRDRLAAETDVLCFEMEAAGLMNHFPCLVIRGICDYSDSHKTKEWQAYAAMAAAAYAKDLLSRIAPQKIEEERRIHEVLSEVYNMTSDMNHNVAIISSSLAANDDHEVLDWITRAEHYHYQNDYFNQHLDGTGRWLLECDQFRQWVNTDSQTLFCPGMPGAGKTIITSIVVRHLFDIFRDTKNIGIAYIYCSYRLQHEQNVQTLLSSLLKQLCRLRTSMPESVRTVYGTHKDSKASLSSKDLLRLLYSVIGLYSRVFIVIDGLDECQTSDGTRWKLLESMQDLRSKHNTNLFATSRFSMEVRDSLEGSLEVEIHAHDEDVWSYLDDRMSRLPGFVRRSSVLQDEIKTTIIGLVGGMFLLAQLYLDLLVGKPTLKALRVALSELPSGTGAYDYAYQHALERIAGQVKDQALLGRHILMWVAFSKRLLTLGELRTAVAVEIGQSTLDEDNLPETEDMISVCAGLLEIDKESKIVRLVHYTTQEYLERTKDYWFPRAEESITTACVTYLSYETFDEGFCDIKEDFQSRFLLNPLYRYAACYWGNHAREGSTSSSEDTRIVRFLEAPAKVEASSQVWDVWIQARGYQYFEWTNEHCSRCEVAPRSRTGMHLAALFGLSKTAAALIQRGHYPDPKDSFGRTPLSLAAERGFGAFVEVLLRTKCVDVHSAATCKPWIGWTPLSFAAGQSHLIIARQLLDSGASIHGDREKFPGSPVFAAALKGKKTMLKFLLEAGADAKASAGEDLLEDLIRIAQDEGQSQLPGLYDYLFGNELNVEAEATHDDGSLLLRAVEIGAAAVIDFLLSKGADIESRDRNGRTALWWASEKQAESIVKYLCNKGADIDVLDRDGRSALSRAAGQGRQRISECLLAQGASLDLADMNGRIPLSWAAGNVGGTAVFEALYRRSDLESADKDGRTPLSWAAAEDGLVEVLVGHHADINSRDKDGRTPLSWAAGNGKLRSLCYLLRYHADVESEDADGRTLLSWASENGHCAVVTHLLREGSDIDAVDKTARTSLSWAAGRGRAEVVRLLLLEKATVMAADQYGWTSLWHAVREGHLETAMILCEPGLDIKWVDNIGNTLVQHLIGGGGILGEGREALLGQLLARGANIDQLQGGRTPLSWASEEGDIQTVMLLCDHQAQLEAVGKTGRTPLSWAAGKGHSHIVSYLVSEGAHIGATDSEGRSPLSWAAWRGHREIVHSLLQAGADINLADEKQRTPTWYARQGEHQNVVKLLNDAGAEMGDISNKRARHD